MRVTLAYAVMLVCSFTLSAKNSSGQSIDKELVTVELSGQGIRSLIELIEKQSTFRFMYNPKAFADFPLITLKKENRTIKETLDLAFVGTGTKYFENGKYVVLERSEDALKSPVMKVSGKVSSSTDNSSMAGVNVVIKGSTFGTTTDLNGTYVIEAREDDVLIFSFIGFKMIEAPVSGRAVIDVALQEDVSSLGEVVVNAGYYYTTDKLRTGNIAKVTAKDIEKQPITNPLMALQGRVAGVDITPYNGVPGSSVRVEIRGRNGINSQLSYPLYVIDGIPIDSRPVESSNEAMLDNKGFDPISMLNPANIKSIEILKDGDATAIYGSRGANGVILITTKSGEQVEKTNVDISLYSGVGKISHFLDVLNTKEYITLRKDAYKNAGFVPSPMSYFDRDLAQWDTTRYTDWQKALLGGSAKINDIQANISSGNKNTSFRFGFGFHQEKMILPGDFGFKRASGNFNLNHLSNDNKFNATVSLNYGVELTNLTSGNNLMGYIYLPPNAPALYDDNGNLNWENSTWTNPLASLNKTDNSRGNTLIVNSMLSYRLLKGLNAKVNLGYNALEKHSIAKKSPFSAMNPARITEFTTAISTFDQTRRSSWIIEPQLVYDIKKDNHQINLVLGLSFQNSENAYQLVEARGYTSDVTLESLRGATSTDYQRDDDSQYRYAAVFGRVGYNYAGKYLLNVTGRRDGSSRFGPDKRWGNFGAVGAGWLFSRESFMADLPFVSFGKLRGSYGVTGSDQIGDYQFLSTYTYMDFLYQNGISLAPTGLSNSAYAWEQTNKLEFAMELGLFDGRLNIEASRYRNRCSNQLLQFQLPGITGFSGVIQNLDATVENRGWELLVNAVNVSTGVFKWSTSLNISIPRNELMKYPALESSPYKDMYVVGKPLNIQRTFKYLGVNPTTGLYEVLDVDNNGSFDEKDRVVINDLTRRYFGGIQNTLSYKGFELNFLFQFSKQTIFGDEFFLAGYDAVNLPARYVNYWKEEGDVSEYQKVSADGTLEGLPAGLAAASDAAYLDNSFLRLKSISLSYSLPATVLQKMSLKAARVYGQAQNLLTLTDFPGIDPETGNSIPPLRMITLGLEVRL